jgi:hypothetical protein
MKHSTGMRIALGVAVGVAASASSCLAVASSAAPPTAQPATVDIIGQITPPVVTAEVNQLAPSAPVVPASAPVPSAAPSAVAPSQTAAVTPTPSPVASPVIVPPTTTTPAPAQYGPQPVGPSVTVMVTNCYVTWTATVVDPRTGVSAQVQQGYGGDCGEANAMAATIPGAVVTQVTNPMTTDPADAPAP